MYRIADKQLTKRVDRLTERLDKLARDTGHPEMASDWLSEETRAEVRTLKAEGKMTAAIKLVQQKTELWLPDVKKLVEKL